MNMELRRLGPVLLILCALSVIVGTPALADYYMNTVIAQVLNIKNDPVEMAIVTIPIEHHEAHEGEKWFMSDYDSDTDTALPKNYTLVSPDDGDIHLIYGIATSDTGVLYVYENATTTANGTALTQFNNYRGKGKSPLKVFGDPKVNVTGTLLSAGLIGSGSGPRSTGGGTTRANEIILYRGTTYYITFVPTNDNTKLSLELDYYEVE